MPTYSDDDTLITQLCNWTELEERGFKEEVGKAAVIFSPDDFGKVSQACFAQYSWRSESRPPNMPIHGVSDD